MSTGYQIKDQTCAHFLTLQIVAWVDIFTRKVYKDILVDALNYCTQHKGLIIFEYVIMSNHLHIIAQSSHDNLSGIVRDFKSYTSKEMLKYIQSGKESRDKWMLAIFKSAAIKHKRNAVYQVWTHENHAIEIYSASFFEKKLDYIHSNPVKSGIVENEDE
jgi:REP element-mobilizing transposase RayT